MQIDLGADQKLGRCFREAVEHVDGDVGIEKDPRYSVVAAALTTSLRLDAASAALGDRVGIANAGHWGNRKTCSLLE